MNVLAWMAIGGFIGWLASVATRIDTQERMFLNVAIGIVGAAFSGWFLTSFLGLSAMNQGNLSIGGILMSLLGAVSALLIVNGVRYVAEGIKW